MSTFSWLEDSYEIYETSPIAVNSFDLVGEKVELFLKNCNLEEFLGISEDSVGSYCGITFKRDQLMYHCR